MKLYISTSKSYSSNEDESMIVIRDDDQGGRVLAVITNTPLSTQLAEYLVKFQPKKIDSTN